MKIEETKPDWKNLIAEQEKSGLSQAEFCRQHELDLAKFGYHRGRIKTNQLETISKKSEWQSVKISSADKCEEIKILLPNGFQCIFSYQHDVTQIKKIIEILLLC